MHRCGVPQMAGLNPAVVAVSHVLIATFCQNETIRHQPLPAGGWPSFSSESVLPPTPTTPHTYTRSVRSCYGAHRRLAASSAIRFTATAIPRLRPCRGVPPCAPLRLLPSALVVRPFAEIRALRADMSDGERAACEVTHPYDGPSGGSYWGSEASADGEPSAGGSRKRPAGASPKRRPSRPPSCRPHRGPPRGARRRRDPPLAAAAEPNRRRAPRHRTTTAGATRPGSTARSAATTGYTRGATGVAPHTAHIAPRTQCIARLPTRAPRRTAQCARAPSRARRRPTPTSAAPSGPSHSEFPV